MIKSILVKMVVLSGFVALSGCAALIPYEEEFACKRPNNMGKCIDTESAYAEIMSGESNTPFAKPYSDLEDGESNQAPSKNDTGVNTSVTVGSAPQLSANSGYNQYLDANYKETAKLLNAGVTPVLSGGDTIKIVLLPNSITNRTLLSERTMYVIIEQPEFIMGDYLIPKSKPIIDLFGE
jgi:hypothetical protein